MFYNSLKTASISREKKTIELLSNQIDIILNSAESEISTIATDQNLQKTLADIEKNQAILKQKESFNIRAKLSTIIYKNSTISGIILHTASGEILSSDQKFVSLLNKKVNTITNINEWYGPVFDIHQVPYIYICKEIYNISTGKKLGFIEIFIEEDLLSKNYTDANYINYSNFFIVNKENTILSSFSKNSINTKIESLKTDLKFDSYDKNILVQTNKPDKSLILSTFNTSLNSTLIAYLHLDKIVTQKTELTFYLLIIFVLSIFIIYIFSKFISKSISKPLTSLYDAMNNVEEGNWNIDSLDSSSDELGLLLLKFKKLLGHIKILIEKLQNEERQKKQFELELLQTQIKPHFLYNSLESISSLIELDMKDDAVESILSLSNFYRGILSKGSTMISLRDELKITKEYLEIMKIRYSNIFDYYLYCDDNLLDLTCPKLLIQPLVENSIYHGLKNSNTKGSLIVSIFTDDIDIVIIVEDTGVGINKNRQAEIFSSNFASNSQNGFALKNIKERLSLFYGTSYKFELVSTINQGCCITIKLPMQKNNRFEGVF
ncbi:MAG: histidine kinase [Sarcina sp.]